MIVGIIRKNRLKKVIFKQFIEARDKNDWAKIDTLSKRYIRVCDLKTKIIK